MVPSSRQSRCGLRYKRATGTFALRCGFDFPPSRPPSLESPPSCSTDSAPAAGAYSVTPPPHRPVWEETGRRCLDIGAGLSPARRWFPRVGADAYIGPYERTAAASPRRGRTLAGLSLPYLPFSTLVGAAFMAARGRPQGSPLRRYAFGRVPRLSPFRVGGRRPKAASLAPLGQFTFCPHRPALCRAGASSI